MTGRRLGRYRPLLVCGLLFLAGCSISDLFDGGESGSADGPVSASSAPGTAEVEVDSDGREDVDRGIAVAVARVIDGDSVEVTIDGETVDVRLDGYNAPELYGPATNGERDERTCNGERAKAALVELLAVGSVRVVGDDIDRFGRRLAGLTADGRSIGPEMVAQGWGLAVGDEPLNRAAMKRAASGGLGMWGPGCGVPVAAGLVIGDHQVNPSGSDRENLDQEWVSVVNRSENTVDLADWVIRDDTTGHRFELRGVLGPQQTLVVRSGRGRSTAEDLFLDETFPVWSNSNETVLLVDPTGVIATWAFID